MTILLQDDFNDNSLDLAKWTLNDPTDDFSETNNQAEFFLNTVNEPEIDLTSIVSVSSGKFTMQAFFSTSSPLSASTPSRLNLYDNFQTLGLVLRYETGTFFVVGFGETGIPSPKDVKIEYDYATDVADYYYWDGNSWINMASVTGNFVPTNAKLLITATFAGTENVTAIADNVFFTDNFYTTHYPISEAERKIQKTVQIRRGVKTVVQTQ
ncbi:MAG: hypothetical protein ACREAK_02090 [Nitrosarchaeum sp.]